jgi:hypothetical protein
MGISHRDFVEFLEGYCKEEESLFRDPIGASRQAKPGKGGRMK